MKKIKLVTLGMFLCLAFSCNENDIEKNDELTNSSGNTKVVAEESETNPYEYVGVMHNAFLDRYFDEQPNSIDEIFDLSLTNASENGMDVSMFNRDEMLEMVNYSITHKLSEGLYMLYDQKKISEIVYQNLSKLVPIIENQNDGNAETALHEITDLEHSFLSIDCNDTDKAILLSTISIAKYSTMYWKEYYGNNNNNNKYMARSLFGRIFAAVCADAMGAITGGIVGTIIGGPVGGAIGALVNGAGASAGVQLVTET